MHKTSDQNAFADQAIAKRIDHCKQKILEGLDVRKLIVFGSYARGKATMDSTIDLLVIAETELNFFDRIKRVLDLCSGGVPSVEPIVYTPEEFAELLKHGEGFLEDAIEEGVVIYQK